MEFESKKKALYYASSELKDGKPMKLNHSTKRAFIKRLRSGKYKQGYGNLHSNNKYCCLGVYCRMKGYSIVDINGLQMPDEVGEETIDYYSASFLAELNDATYKKSGRRMFTFNDIADIIERYM